MNGSEAVLNVIAALEGCGIPYMLVGSYSTNAYGIPRSTQDADFVIELGETSIGDLARRLAPSIRVDPQMSFETVTMTRRYVAEVVGTAFKIELFLLNDDPYNQERFRRRQLVSTLDRQVWLPTPEDVIVTKLHWASLQGDRRTGTTPAMSSPSRATGSTGTTSTTGASSTVPARSG